MADENSMGDAGTPPGAAGGPESVHALFGGGSTPPGQETPPDASQTPSEPPEEFVAGRVPKQFYREDGQHDYDGLSKSWFDTRTAHDNLKARLAELEKAQGDRPTFDAFAAEINWDAVAERAPNAYLKPEEGQENQAAMALVRRLHEHGMPAAGIQAAVADYYADLNALVPERKSDEDLRKAALAHLGPNGAAMLDEVKNGLATLATKRAWPEGEMAVLKSMLSNGPATSVLHQLIVGRGSVAPPDTSGVASEQKTREQEQAEVRKLLATTDPNEWASIKDDVLARARACGLDQIAA